MKNILLVGDSIREGYAKYVRETFKNTANVFYPPENSMFSTYIVRFISEWRLQYDTVDMVHWNAGIWDALHISDGDSLVPLDVYRNNIDRICKIIKEYYPEAKMTFATTTPVIDVPDELYRISNNDIQKYNAVAVDTVKKHGGAINDLYSLMINCPSDYHSDRIHYDTVRAAEILTNAISDHICNTLAIKADKLDFDDVYPKELGQPAKFEWIKNKGE